MTKYFLSSSKVMVFAVMSVALDSVSAKDFVRCECPMNVMWSSSSKCGSNWFAWSMKKT